MILLSGAKLAEELGTSGAQISRMKKAGYLNYYEDTKNYELEEAREAWDQYQKMQSGELVNLAKVAQILGTSRSTITQMTHNGKLKVVEVGSKEVFYKLKDIMAIKESRQSTQKESTEEDSDEKELKLATMRVDLESKKLALAEKKREVVSISLLDDQMTTLFRKLGEMTEILPARIITQIKYCQTDEERQERIAKELNKYLKSLVRFMEDKRHAG